MARVLVYAYCGNNFGDDLFIDILVRRYPRASFDLLCPGWEHLRAFEHHPRVQITGLRGFRRAARHYDAFVLIGGSMFQQVGRWWRGTVYLGLLLLIARLAKVPAVAMGLSFGPAHGRLFVCVQRFLLRQFEWLSLRDRRSVAQLGLRRAECLPDLAFGLAGSAPAKTPGSVGISVMAFGPGVSLPGYESYLTELISGLAEHRSVQLFCLQEDTGINDTAVAERVLAGVRDGLRPAIGVQRYLDDPVEFVARLQSCETFVATRLHAMIVAAAGGARTAVIGYHHKIADLIETTGLRVAQIDAARLDDPAALIQQVLAAELPTTGSGIIDRLRVAALDHFRRLDSLLAGARGDQR